MCPSSWRILASRVNPFTTRLAVPSIFDILSRCSALGSMQQVELAKRIADLYLHPPTEEFSMFDWLKVGALADAGYHHAVGALAEWRPGKAPATAAP
jgi:predicted acylesterase/phospholipase RssA